MEFKSALKPIWCPGCGDFGVLQALYRALAAVGRPPHEVAFVSGIGCSSRIPGYTTAYGFNSIHGRALPIAQGIKIASPELLVIVAGGDGDGFSIAGGHVPHAVRRNVDLTYVVMDNQIYGLTKGQLSPTSRQGTRTVTSVTGSIEQPFNPLLTVLAYGARSRAAAHLRVAGARAAGRGPRRSRRARPGPGAIRGPRALSPKRGVTARGAFPPSPASRGTRSSRRTAWAARRDSPGRTCSRTPQEVRWRRSLIVLKRAA